MLGSLGLYFPLSPLQEVLFDVKETEILVQEKASPKVSTGHPRGCFWLTHGVAKPLIPTAGPVSPLLSCSLLRGTLPQDQQCLCILRCVSILVHGSPPHS